MKTRVWIIAVAAVLPLMTVSETHSATREIEAPISSVTVYPNRAGITRTAEVQLEAGEQSVVIQNLPSQTLESSFRASAIGAGGVTLLGLKHRVEQHIEAPQQRVAELQEQIRLLESDTKQSVSDRIESFNQQKKLLTSITEGSAGQISDQLAKGGLEVRQWGEAYSFIGRGVREANDSIRAANRELYEIDRLIQKLKADLDMIQSQGSTITRTVQIDLRLARPGDVQISLDYVVPGAEWRPLYDARLIDDAHIDLTYFAEVTQRTGEDWNDVDLTLSTASPSEGTGPGDFVAWYLSLVEYVKLQEYSVDKLLRQPADVATSFSEDEPVFVRGGRAGEVGYIVDGVPVLRLAYSMVFPIGRKERIPSGNEAVRTTIGQWRLDSDMKLICRPRNRQAVFRLATITNQSDAPLLPGTVAIFAESDYLGDAVIDEYITPNEEFDLPFGSDNNLEVKREILAYKKGEKTGILSSKNQEGKTITITLTNHSGQLRTIEVEEAIPVSQDERIKVKLEDPDPQPIAIDEKGKATWTITLSPQQEQVILLPYRVNHPSDAEIVGF